MLRLNQGCTTGLDGLNLAHIDRTTAEAGRQLGDVKGDALGRKDRAELVARGAANAGISTANGLLEGTVLLGVVTVGAEGVVPGSRVAVAIVRGEALGELA